MRNLYWKTDGTTRTLIEKPFKTESELETFIFTNQDILGGDVLILYRQVRTGAKQGIPDMLGVDQDDQICLIELKNAEAGEEVLPQALGYAIWAETNPDSIKAIWLESKTKPEDVQIDWDNLNIRVMLIAPSFKSNVPRMAGKMGYPIDLIQIRRYGLEDNEFLVVEALDEPKGPKVIATKAKGTWDWAFYESEHGKDSTQQFRHTVEAVAALVKHHNWDAPYNLYKYYTGFKLGNKVIFGVGWGGTYAWHLRFRIPEQLAKEFRAQDWEFQRYDATFHEAIFRPIKPASVEIEELEVLFVRAYEQASGTQ
jgi:hypothetical protein